eukprot:Skav216751  [mRNA]  locus=scaffold3744:121922:123603:+ [translate_table: standard]
MAPAGGYPEARLGQSLGIDQARSRVCLEAKSSRWAVEGSLSSSGLGEVAGGDVRAYAAKAPSDHLPDQRTHVGSEAEAVDDGGGGASIVSVIGFDAGHHDIDSSISTANGDAH